MDDNLILCKLKSENLHTRKQIRFNSRKKSEGPVQRSFQIKLIMLWELKVAVETRIHTCGNGQV